jgi:hypothetical protein
MLVLPASIVMQIHLQYSSIGSYHSSVLSGKVRTVLAFALQYLEILQQAAHCMCMAEIPKLYI